MTSARPRSVRYGALHGLLTDPYTHGAVNTTEEFRADAALDNVRPFASEDAVKAVKRDEGATPVEGSLRLLLDAEERAARVTAAAEEEAAAIVAAARVRAGERLDGLAGDLTAAETELRARIAAERDAAIECLAQERDREVRRLRDALSTLETWKDYVVRRLLANGAEER